MISKLARTFLLPVVLYSAVAVFMTYPLVTQLHTDVIGNQFTDSFEFVRLGWWGKYALQQGYSPFYQNLFAYPTGFFSTIQWSQPLVYWPISVLNLFTTPAMAYNLWILAELILAGLTAYWLCLSVIGDSTSLAAILGALLGGLIFMDSQTMQGQLSGGHANILGVYALPPLAWALYCIAQGRGTRRNIVLGAVAMLVLLLSNYTSPVYLIFPLFLMFFLYFAVGSLVRREPMPWKILRNAGLVLIGGIILSMPFYLPLAIESASPDRPAFYNVAEIVHFSADLMGFITPSPETPWTKFLENQTNRRIIDEEGVEGAAYLGIVASLLALAGVFAFRRNTDKKPYLWVVIALGSMALSLGPVLKWADNIALYYASDFSGSIPMPLALFQNLPVFNLARTPGRINFVTMLCVGALAALGFVWLAQRIKRPVLRVTLAIVLAVFAIAEYQEFFPFPTISARLPAIYAQIAKDPNVRAVFDVPLYSEIGSRDALYEQTAHLKPLIAGYVNKGTPVSTDKLALLTDIAMGQADRTQDGQPLDVDTARAVLKANGIDVVVYHWQGIEKTLPLAWADKAFKSLYQDDNSAIFSVPAPQNNVDPSAITYVDMGSNLPGELPWFSANSSILVFEPDSEDRHFTLNLKPLLAQRTVKVTVDGQYAGLKTIASPAQQLDFWLQLTPGFHRLQFTFPDGCTVVPVTPECEVGSTQCSLPTAPLQVNQEQCVSAGVNSISLSDAGDMDFTATSVALGQGLSLKGYRLPKTVKSGDPLTLETDWQATQILDGDYHYFVHVIGPDGGVAGEYDSVPDNSNFSTTKWGVHQQWNELDSLAISGKPGKYSVTVGWYRYPDLTRLPIQSDEPHAANGEVYLGDIEIK